MSFLLRALVVIGFLTYFAAQQPDATRPAVSVAAQPSLEAVALPAAWTALPAAARERIFRDGSADLARRLTALRPSQDTLGESDRRPAWRGIGAP